jgi:hypothetical protein
MSVFTPKQNKRRSRRQEAKLANEAGGKTQKGSGCLPWAKGDVRKKGKFRAECKFTKKMSFSMSREILDKIRSECAFDETPVLDVTFIDANGRTEDHWVAVPYEVWLAQQNKE